MKTMAFHGVVLPNYQSPITNYQLPITNYQLPITNHQYPITHQITDPGGHSARVFVVEWAAWLAAPSQDGPLDHIF
jgi:hypothetical protein